MPIWRHTATWVFARSPTGRLSLSLTATGSSNPDVRPEDLRAQTFYVTLPPRTCLGPLNAKTRNKVMVSAARHRIARSTYAYAAELLTNNTKNMICAVRSQSAPTSARIPFPFVLSSDPAHDVITATTVQPLPNNTLQPRAVQTQQCELAHGHLPILPIRRTKVLNHFHV